MKIHSFGFLGKSLRALAILSIAILPACGGPTIKPYAPVPVPTTQPSVAPSALATVQAISKTSADVDATIRIAAPLNSPPLTQSLVTVKSDVGSSATAAGATLSDAKAKDVEVAALRKSLDAANAATKQATDVAIAAQADAAKWKSTYENSWFGGRFWFWFWTIVGSFTGVGIALFVAEFFFGLNIHPLTWLVEAGGWVGKALINVAKGVAGEAKAIAAYIRSRFAPAPATPVAPPAAPPAVKA